MSRKRNQIGAQFVAFSIDMLTSHAWRALPDCARRVVERIAIEHMRQGAAENGRLACTYTDFAEVGLNRNPTIAFGIRAACALGFLQVTEQGGQAIGGDRRPSRYRITFLVGRGKNAEPTHEWKKIKTAEHADQAVEAAKAFRSELHSRRGRLGLQTREANSRRRAA